ncbi:membrane alanyl aminopeptidase-like [Cydia fagiglandana]|uniref:membrane alanyl aminopeptidase-like n=1 Tax=Cydia fagiglandana TaxID=1458189 RepID=UPI002FEE0CA6
MIRAFFFLFLTASASAVLTTFKIDEECLNFTVYPVQYELTIIPRIYTTQSFNYNCELVITVIANAPHVRMIELDAKDLGIESVNVYKDGNDIISRNTPFNHDTERGKLFIYLSEPLREYKVYNTRYQIKIKFRKNVFYDSSGIFAVKYDDEMEGIKYMLLTRLSRGHAKYFFPCFSNERFEAVFKFRVNTLTGAHGMQYTNSSLVIAQEQRTKTDKDGYIFIEYLPSPQVSLNEVGFVYSQFSNSSIRSRNSNDTIVIWAPGPFLVQYNYILKFGQSILEFIHDYAGINRNITTGPINVVPVPSNNLDGYEIGSWNLWTNGDFRLKYQPELISIRQIEKMTFDFTQQLCRVWLGNPGEERRTSWREEWFKEGMATYFAYYFLGKYHQTGERQSGWPYGFYGLESRHNAMSVDWYHSTPALINFNRTLAVDIPNRHKELVTMKTAALLWMVENWIGPEKFHPALVKYINMRRGSFINLEDFMINLDKETVECFHQFSNGTTSSMVLNSWFWYPGYPVINVHVYRDRLPNVITLKQRTFSFTKDFRYDSKYLIPISYVAQYQENCFNCHQPRFIISTPVYTFGENLDGGWILLNRHASGYYRVNYDVETWKLIAKTLRNEHNAIHQLNRAQIVNDAFALYTSGDLSYVLATHILGYLEKEQSYVVWESVISGFELLKTKDAACNFTRALYEEWRQFMRKHVAAIYARLIQDLEQQPKTRLFRSNIINFACALQHESCVNRVLNLYYQTKGRRHRLDPDSRQACYYAVLRESGDVAYQLRTDNLTSFENEDRTVARHLAENEQRLIYRLPPGIKPIANLVLNITSTLPTSNPTAQALDKDNPDSSTSVHTSIVCLILTYLVTTLF